MWGMGGVLRRGKVVERSRWEERVRRVQDSIG